MAEKDAVLKENRRPSKGFFSRNKCNEINTFQIQWLSYKSNLLRLLNCYITDSVPKIICKVSSSHNIRPLYWFQCYTQHMPLIWCKRKKYQCTPRWTPKRYTAYTTALDLPKCTWCTPIYKIKRAPKFKYIGFIKVSESLTQGSSLSQLW